MGWWNETIYGGDTPVVWKEKIYELCGAEEYNKKNKPKAITKSKLKKNIEGLRELIDNSGDTKDNKNVGYQVLGAICMHSGFDFELNSGLKSRILDAVDDDQWASENVLRKTVLTNFKKIIKEYDFSEPVNIEAVNVFEEAEDEDNEDIAKEFKEVFSLINARKKKLRNGIEEKSGVAEYDEGFADASEAEMAFLDDFKELLAKQEMMGALLERISKGMVGQAPQAESNTATVSEAPAYGGSKSVDAGRADEVPG